MNHMNEAPNPHAHPLNGSHLRNPMIAIHATCMFTAYGILMPIGIMLGIRRNKYHVPLNAAMFLIAMTGYLFGYAHHLYEVDDLPMDQGHEDMAGGAGAHNDTDAHQHFDEQASGLSGIPGMKMFKRQAGDTSAEHYGWAWKASAHSIMANVLLVLLFLQVGVGVYRKLIKTRPRLRLSRLSNAVPRNIHSYLGKIHLVLAYIQITLGVIGLTEACPGQAFGQCISHIVMGGSFWWYGGVYIAYLVGSFPGITRPEWYESLAMTIWGVINFSVLHQWGTRWSHSDLQHTSLGLLWVGGGLLSLVLESKYSPLSQFLIRKNPIPALLIILTGFAMGQHFQYYQFATMVHTFFGYCLMLGGLCRLIQLALRPAVSPTGSDRNGADDEDDTTLEEDAPYKNKAQQGSGQGDRVPGLALGESPVSSFFGFLSALGVISAGLMFQSAHEEQLNIIMYYLTDASTYINWIMALAFFSVVFILLLTQVGKKNIGEGAATKPTYNRVRTRTHSEERNHVQSRDEIEMSGYSAVDV
ncbi:hypothetical protein B0O80DRAFT_442247 [Mortierella sp. GBAus27b]|nr:hypothetical protein BGX31_007755 [Mortierella sp. GBA43]KAI8358839.1 hypothetical protein B0O80DRAFT_442247 [Mortierella sp. GBAus27b]